MSAAMRRSLVRALATTILIGSFTLCAASVVFWVRSYRTTDFVTAWWEPRGRGGEIHSCLTLSQRGTLCIGLSWKDPPLPEWEVHKHWRQKPKVSWEIPGPNAVPYEGANAAPPRSVWNHLGFYLQANREAAWGWPGWDAAVPYWFVMALAALGAAFGLVLRRR